MAEPTTINLKVRFVPDRETLDVILKLLDLWQDANPDKMIAMVPAKDRYVYEIIDRRENNGNKNN